MSDDQAGLQIPDPALVMTPTAAPVAAAAAPAAVTAALPVSVPVALGSSSTSLGLVSENGFSNVVRLDPGDVESGLCLSFASTGRACLLEQACLDLNNLDSMAHTRFMLAHFDGSSCDECRLALRNTWFPVIGGHSKKAVKKAVWRLIDMLVTRRTANEIHEITALLATLLNRAPITSRALVLTHGDSPMVDVESVCDSFGELFGDDLESCRVRALFGETRAHAAAYRTRRAAFAVDVLAFNTEILGGLKPLAAIVHSFLFPPPSTLPTPHTTHRALQKLRPSGSPSANSDPPSDSPTPTEGT